MQGLVASGKMEKYLESVALGRESAHSHAEEGMQGKTKHAIESHLWPAASPVLDGISSLQLHLLADRNARTVITQVALANGLGDGSVDSLHAHALRTSLFRIVVRGKTAITLVPLNGLFEFGRIR